MQVDGDGVFNVRNGSLLTSGAVYTEAGNIALFNDHLVYALDKIANQYVCLRKHQFHLLTVETILCRARHSSGPREGTQ